MYHHKTDAITERTPDIFRLPNSRHETILFMRDGKTALAPEGCAFNGAQLARIEQPIEWHDAIMRFHRIAGGVSYRNQINQYRVIPSKDADRLSAFESALNRQMNAAKVLDGVPNPVQCTSFDQVWWENGKPEIGPEDIE